MAAELVYEKNGQERRLALDREALIGRLPECDVVIDSNQVSRKHARVFRDGNVWRVEDLSRNGTRINALRNADKILEHGDRIWVAQVSIAFVDAGRRLEPVAEPVPSPGQNTIFRSAVDFSGMVSTRGTEQLGSSDTTRVARLVRMVHEASRSILAADTLDQTLERMLDLAFDHLSVQRGIVLLRDPETDELIRRAERQRGEGKTAVLFSRTIAKKVLSERLSVITTDAQQDQSFDAAQSIISQGIRSAMAAPLWNGENVEGVIYVDMLDQAGAFDAFDLDLLSALGNHIAVSIERHRLQQAALEKERLDRELAVAREIQIGILPREMPRLPGYDLAGVSIPADETGGDTYDLVPVGERQMMVLLGDATGHGLGPALSVTQVRSMLRIAMRLGADLDRTFTSINDQLADDLADNRFVTAFLGLLDAEHHRIAYHAGGQGPLLIYRAATGECELRKASTMPMGFLGGISPAQGPAIELAPGDILALITDGLYEYANPRDEMFGEQRVVDLVRRHHAEPMQRLVEILEAAGREYGGSAPQADDLTIVLIRRLTDRSPG